MMNHHAATEHERIGEEKKRGFLGSPMSWIFTGFLAVAGFYLVTEHQAHLYGVLPWLLLLACPLMHVFMHHGHRGDRHGSQEPKSNGPQHRGSSHGL